MISQVLLHTIHSFTLLDVEALIPVDSVLEVLFWVGDLADLVIFVDEVSAGREMLEQL